MSKEHLNYLRRKTADEAELWAADRIEELEGANILNSNALRLQKKKKKKCDALRADNAELVAALNRLYVACPTTLECRHFHHSQQERHSYIEPCGPADEYLEALNQARAALAKVRKP